MVHRVCLLFFGVYSVEYPDDSKIMKNMAVLYRIETLGEGEIGILRKISNMGKRPPRRPPPPPVVTSTVASPPVIPTVPVKQALPVVSP